MISQLAGYAILALVIVGVVKAIAARWSKVKKVTK